jgi:D-alanine transaminase
LNRISYVNGRFVRHAHASVHVEDRGFQFGDAVYEVWTVFDGRLLDEEGHFTRLDRSLSELSIRNPKSRQAYLAIIRELLRRNRIRDGLIYLQVSRGAAPRDHVFGNQEASPTVVLTAKRVDFKAKEAKAAIGVSVITLRDQRWSRCDIKTVNLLPNVLAKQAAFEAGAGEAWLLDAEDFITEGSSSNAWIVTSEGVLMTRPADNAILNGVTRRRVIACAKQLGLGFEERAFSLSEAVRAREAFITSASTFVTPVVQIDDEIIANGAPGSISLSLRDAYQQCNQIDTPNIEQDGTVAAGGQPCIP